MVGISVPDAPGSNHPARSGRAARGGCDVGNAVDGKLKDGTSFTSQIPTVLDNSTLAPGTATARRSYWGTVPQDSRVPPR